MIIWGSLKKHNEFGTNFGSFYTYDLHGTIQMDFITSSLGQLDFNRHHRIVKASRSDDRSPRRSIKRRINEGYKFNRSLLSISVLIVSTVACVGHSTLTVC